jgi:hypothetical protein
MFLLLKGMIHIQTHSLMGRIMHHSLHTKFQGDWCSYSKLAEIPRNTRQQGEIITLFTYACNRIWNVSYYSYFILVFHHNMFRPHLQVESISLIFLKCHQYHNESVVFVLSRHVVRTTLILIYNLNRIKIKIKIEMKLRIARYYFLLYVKMCKIKKYKIYNMY